METRPSNVPQQLQDTFFATGDAAGLMAGRTVYADRLVLDQAAQWLFPAVPSGVALLAVGGYGRRHLFPYSDIDLLLLFDNDRLAEGSRESISKFLQQLWDANLRVSQSVRTPAECAELHDSNIELNVSLLDQRFLGGDRNLYAKLAERLPRFIHGQRGELIRNLGRLTHERHAKFAETFYHLEPNVKETPGGLRDFQLICWLQQIRETDMGRLAAADPAPELQQAFRFLSRLRTHLHYRNKRDANVLNFESQDDVAAAWETGEAQLMREYYRHARNVYRVAVRQLETQEAAASSLFSQFRDWRSRVSNADFSVTRDRIHFRVPQKLDQEPELLLELFRFMARHGIKLSYEAEQRIEAKLPALREYFLQPRAIWPAIRDIFSLPHAPLAIRAMHDSGALNAVFPELKGIDSLVLRDFYHRYTVDEHTLVAIGNLWALRKENDPPLRLYRDLLAESPEPAVLTLALLFHDSGKAKLDENHIVVSHRFADAALARIQAPAAERETVLFLIDRHADLSITLQTRDIYDPQTAATVAAQLGTVERLRALTLVTYADISAVNPTVMTPWRAGQLWQLYLAGYNELTSGLETDRIEEAPTGPPRRVEFIAGFPTRYLRTHSEAEIDQHVELEEKSRKRGVAVEIEKLETEWKVTLVSADRPYLFASVAGTLSSFRLNILKAEAFANKRGVILDSFTFADPSRNLELNPPEVERLRTTIERVIQGKQDVKELLKSRPVPPPPTSKSRIYGSVSFNQEASRGATLVEIVAQDRPGLLYDLASAISSHGCNIEVVLIDTEAHKAIDVFYLTRDGAKLAPDVVEHLGAALREASC